MVSCGDVGQLPGWLYQGLAHCSHLCSRLLSGRKIHSEEEALEVSGPSNMALSWLRRPSYMALFTGRRPSYMTLFMGKETFIHGPVHGKETFTQGPNYWEGDRHPSLGTDGI